MENQKIVEVKLSEAEYNNLLIFMQRVNLKGGEVPAFAAIMGRLEAAAENGE